MAQQWRVETGSGIVRAEAATPPSAEEAIRKVNEELRRRTAGFLDLPLTVAIEQRDAALRKLSEAQTRAELERSKLLQEQDAFITTLMEDHERSMEALQQQLARAKEALERHRLLAPPSSAGQKSRPDVEPDTDPGGVERQIRALQQELESAYAEIDETRDDAVRLQGERDDAVAAIDDMRLELLGEVDAARDEAFQLQTQLDEAQRLAEDARDEAREHAFELTEQLDEVRRQLDARHAEVADLRQRLALLTNEKQPSQPPPPSASAELERARIENRRLRKQLIDAMRDLSRNKRELDLMRARHPVTTTRTERIGPASSRSGQSGPATVRGTGRRPAP